MLIAQARKRLEAEPLLKRRFDKLLHDLPEQFFRRFFRVNRATFEFLVETLRPKLQKRHNPLKPAKTVEHRVAVGLYHFAHGGSFFSTGRALEVAESTAHNMVWAFVDAILELLSDEISWPSDQEMVQVSKGFEAKRQLPNCQGAIDCTHFDIKTPDGENSRSYIDRHGKHSVTMQAVVDSQGRFLNVHAGWPGSVHDSRIFNLSPLRKAIRDRVILQGPIANVQGHPIKLGDAGYALQPWMITPILGHNLDAKSESFNFYQSSTRIIVEQAFGILKGRWRWLAGIMHIADATRLSDVLVVACILHNLMMRLNDQFDEEWAGGVNLNLMPSALTRVEAEASDDGKAVRSILLDHAWAANGSVHRRQSHV